MQIRNLGCLLTLLACQFAHADVPDANWFPKAPSLPKPSGQVIKVSNADQLFQAAIDVKPGGTILLADGHYPMVRYFEITTDNVTLRGESGDRNAVILDGQTGQHGELVAVTGCEGVTIADLTIQNIKWNGFKINSDRGAQCVTIHNCVIHNIWQRGVKAPAVPKDKQEMSPRGCRVQFCLFYNDRSKRFADDSTDTPQTFDGNYLGGIDAKNTIGWEITDNVFIGIQGRTREGRACVYISENGKGCLIERNVFIDCDIAIALGNPSLGYSPLQAIDCTARNNLVWNCPETGILACYTRDCRILNNTIYEPVSRMKRLIWVQKSNEGLEVAENLLVGFPILTNTNSKILQRDNLVHASISDGAKKDGTGVSHPNVGQRFLNNSVLNKVAQFAALFAALRDQSAQVTIESSSPADTDPEWGAAMQRVHARFKGDSGVFAVFGDSISDTRAFWSGLPYSRKNASVEMKAAFQIVNQHMPKDCWDRKGAGFGNQSRMTIRWAHENVQQWLRDLNPEVAIIMFGSNDLGQLQLDEYETKTRQVVQKCLDNGTVVILSTIPPRHGYDKKALAFADAVRRIARQMKVPLTDYQAEILKRRPNDWDGSLETFKDYVGYDVPTLISRDGVHPSNPKMYSNDYSTEGLNHNGFALRNYLVLMKYAEVISRLQTKE